ncbi:MAG: phosphoadenosine phosphosulfate reductase family protein [Mycoplasmataceae bacterium]|nr:phosphoadenosine phosphosulfate reductase family protein [Mycoplasmataceae bacterium]
MLNKDFWTEFEKTDTSHQTARKDFLYNEINKWDFDKKLNYAKEKVREFIMYCNDNNLPFPVISFSGGRDSVVLYHLVKQTVEEFKLVELKKRKKEFYPIILVASEFFNPDNVTIIKKYMEDKNGNVRGKIISPKKSFLDVIKTVGYPIISKELSQKIRGVLDVKTNAKWIATCFGYGKGRAIPKKYLHLLDTDFCDFKPTHQCCNLIKGGVKHDKNPKFVGTTIFESQLRRSNWISRGCNIFDKDAPASRPISLWNNEDVEEFIKRYNIKISEAYKKGWKRTGCMFCGFGLNIESSLLEHKKNIQKEKTHLLNILEKIESDYIKDNNNKRRIKRLNDMNNKHNFSKLLNRLELVKVWYTKTYNIFMYGQGEKSLLKPFINSYIQVTNDKKYMQAFRERERDPILV